MYSSHYSQCQYIGTLAYTLQNTSSSVEQLGMASAVDDCCIHLVQGAGHDAAARAWFPGAQLS